MKSFPCSSRRALLLAVALFALPVSSRAQSGPYGPWDGGTRLYVSATGGADTNPGTFAAPFRTITFALTQAAPSFAAGVPVTINVMPGLYDVALGESFPLAFPARGLSLEAHSPGAVIRGNGASTVLDCDSPGLSSGPGGAVPASIVFGMEIENGDAGVGVRLAPSQVGGTALGAPEAVEIRRCTIRDCLIGIRVETADGWRDAHVIEQNCIVGDVPTVGIEIRNDGESSTLIRANKIYDHEIHIVCVGFSGATSLQPRIVSNMMWGAETGVYFYDTSAWMVNNSLAFGRPHSVGLPVYGVLIDGITNGTVTIANNILWNPLGAEVTNFSISITDIQDSNDNQDGAFGTNISVDPQFVNANPLAPDLHVTTTSPCVEVGLNAWVVPGLTLTLPTFVVPADLGNEYDLNWPRMDDFDKNGVARVDIGADEVKIPVIDFTATGPVDALGTIHSGGATATVVLTLTTRPADRCGVYLWSVHSTDPVYQHTFRIQYGNFLVNFATPGDTALIFNGSAANGINTWTWTVDPALFAYESEWYLQGFTTIVGVARGDMTTRLRLELDL